MEHYLSLFFLWHLFLGEETVEMTPNLIHLWRENDKCLTGHFFNISTCIWLNNDIVTLSEVSENAVIY